MIVSRLRLVPAFALVLAAGTASAQCVGDCNADASVTVDEIITGVNIALGTAAISSCDAFDSSGDGAVTVDEILTAVNFALVGCPVDDKCGNGTTDFADGETCDDGNTEDGDECPADCRIESCTPTGETFELEVAFEAPSGVELAAITTFLLYPDGVVRIPGRGNEGQVQDRLVQIPDNISATPNDLDYAVRYVAFSPELSAITPGGLFAATFDRCQGAAAPALADFTCVVEDAADTSINPVDGASCSVRLP